MTEIESDSTHDQLIGSAVAALERGAASLVRWPIAKRREIAQACVASVARVAKEWVDTACEAKRIPPGSKARAEEITGGPIATLRQLQLLVATCDDIDLYNEPMLPGRITSDGGQFRVKVFPTKQLFDSLLFGPIKAETWLEPGVSKGDLFAPSLQGLVNPGTASSEIVCVLGAGNVSSIPATDTLTKILQENKAVLLKMNPVNGYLGDIFKQALAPLIDESVLRIVEGGADVGAAAIDHADIGEVHITGSTQTHDAIVWGTNQVERDQNLASNSPVLSKRITSELGNVTPWAIVPGRYSDRQLKFQAANVAASITNNASFNCIATKLIITSKRWEQREQFLALLDDQLRQTPVRYAYYPGATSRFEAFAEQSADDSGYLPWTVRRDIDLHDQLQMLSEESFVCVCGEVCLEAESPEDFLRKAVGLMNDRIWGTLAASLTIPNRMQGDDELRNAIRDLRYGMIGVNQWSAIGFALMSPPWGAYPGSTLADVQSGIGFVHNTFLLNRPEKTILRSPLASRPKPIWFPSHRCPESVAWQLLNLYTQPSVWHLPRLLASSLRG